MHYYQHHIGDFKRDTDMLTDHQSMVYLRLLWMYYDTEQPLPDDPRRLAFQVRSDKETVALILEHFFEHEDGQWRQSRCDEEIAAYRAKRDQSRDAAKRRWSHRNESVGNADAMRSQCGRNADASSQDANPSKIDANHKPITNNQSNRGKTASRFVPPTPDEVKVYCKERGNSVDPSRFVDFYAAKGWMVGKNKMRDWKAAVRTWEGKQEKQASGGASRRRM